MTFEGLGEMFEGDSADTCSEKFPLVSMEGRAEGLACADPGARTPSALAEIIGSSCFTAVDWLNKCPFDKVIRALNNICYNHGYTNTWTY